LNVRLRGSVLVLPCGPAAAGDLLCPWSSKGSLGVGMLANTQQGLAVSSYEYVVSAWGAFSVIVVVNRGTCLLL